MQLETIFRAVTAVVALVGVGKNFYDLTTVNKSRWREEYKFAKDFLEELGNNPNLHPFAKEKGYRAIVGTTDINIEEIAYILSLKNPTKCLEDYLLGREYLKKLDTQSYSKFTFKNKYSDPWFRKFKKGVYLIAYSITFGLALAPVLIPQYSILIFITMPVYGSCALWFLNKAGKIAAVERLVKNQQKYSSDIHLPTNNPRRLK